MIPLGLPSGFSYIDNFMAMYYRFNMPRLFLNTVAVHRSGLHHYPRGVDPGVVHLRQGRFPAREGLRTAMIATLIMPPVTFLVPSYVMMANLGLIDTSLPVVLLWSATSVPGAFSSSAR